MQGSEGAYLAVRVRAVPEKGQANAALERLIAGWLDLAPRGVKLAGGGKSRLKTLEIAGDSDVLAALIRERLDL